MGVSNLYSLPYHGMKDGLHQYKYTVSTDFFKAFERSPIQEGDFEILVDVDKRGQLLEFVFHVSGKAKAICDRCLTDIMLPVVGKYTLFGKIHAENLDDEDIISIKPDQPTIELSQYIYEMICVSMPMTNVYDCDKESPRVCDDAVLAKLEPLSNLPDESVLDNTIWQNLDGWIKNSKNKI